MDVHEHTVGKWRRRFVQGGIEGLTDEYRAGRPRTVSDAQVVSDFSYFVRVLTP
ncbi:helix-turn-helix domain-containing protein [Sphingorhabdus sp.]|uniref:helix-turn-helix domain-containing protein n=1 Tax=Sphingorhabdus sp. TaxID=1902408 RepID=UPI003D81BD20